MATPTPAYTPPESCMYVYDPVTRCESQRPCDSCLQKPGCLVGVIGACQPLSVKEDDPWYYKRAALRNLTLPGLKDSTNASAIREKQGWEFPSVTTKYCPADDAVCKECIQQRFWLPTGVENDNRYCVGADDCVCIYNCEFNKNVLETVCPRSPEPTLYTDYDTSVHTASPPWTSPPASSTETPSSTPPSTPSTTTTTVVAVETQPNDRMPALDVALIVAGCLVGVACLTWLVRRRRARPSVPMAVLVKADSLNDGDALSSPPARPFDSQGVYIRDA